MAEAPPSLSAPPGDIPQVVAHLFRHEAGKMVGTLTRIFGPEHLSLAEDVVQETLIRALETWPFHGVPDNPSAWLMRVARNLALDVVRREKVFREKQGQIIEVMERTHPAREPGQGEEIGDDRLRLMFVCCHPQIASEAQVALALKTLCGFSITEISRAFLTTEAAIAKRLTRAKQRIREAQIAFEIPEGEELVRRLGGVWQSLYLLFNEGYKASSGDRLVRQEVCEEAIRLASLLAQHAAGNRPGTHALLALMLLNAARLPARVDDLGNLLRLEDQDRSRWDGALLGRGMFHLAQSAAGEEITEYHLQAGIAACHCLAKDFASTDWPQILALYDQLLALNGSAVVALNRAVAVAQVHGPEAGLAALERIHGRSDLEGYYLFYAVRGELEARRGNHAVAAESFRQAVALTELPLERAFLSTQLERCSAAVVAPR